MAQVFSRRVETIEQPCGEGMVRTLVTEIVVDACDEAGPDAAPVRVVHLVAENPGEEPLRWIVITDRRVEFPGSYGGAPLPLEGGRTSTSELPPLGRPCTREEADRYSGPRGPA